MMLRIIRKSNCSGYRNHKKLNYEHSIDPLYNDLQ